MKKLLVALVTLVAFNSTVFAEVPGAPSEYSPKLINLRTETAPLNLKPKESPLTLKANPIRSERAPVEYSTTLASLGKMTRLYKECALDIGGAGDFVSVPIEKFMLWAKLSHYCKEFKSYRTQTADRLAEIAWPAVENSNNVEEIVKFKRKFPTLFDGTKIYNRRMLSILQRVFWNYEKRPENPWNTNVKFYEQAMRSITGKNIRLGQISK